MAVLNMNEPVVEAILARLASDLDGRIAEINAEARTVADGYTIAAPLQTLDHVPALEVIDGGGYPAIGVGDGRGDFIDDIGSSATGVYEQVVVFFLQDADQQALARRLRRYQRAVASALLRDRRMTNGVFNVGLRATRPGPTLDVSGGDDEPRVWVSWGGIVIRCMIEE